MFIYSIYFFTNIKEVFSIQKTFNENSYLNNYQKFYYYLNTENTKIINIMYFNNKEMYDI